MAPLLEETRSSRPSLYFHKPESLRASGYAEATPGQSTPAKRRCFIGKQRREKTQLLTVYHCLCPGPLQQEDSWHILFRQ